MTEMDLVDSSSEPTVAELFDIDGPRPLHTIASDIIRSRIESGRWPANYQLRAEPELAVELGVSRGTLRRAIRSLVEEGRLLRIHGRGTFVAAKEPEPAIAQEYLGISEALAQSGITARIDAVESSMVLPPHRVRALLEIDEHQPTLRLARRFLVDDRPAWFVVSYIRPDICPGIENVDFTRKIVFATLEDDYGLSLSYGRRTFSAQGADRDTAQALQIAQGRPVLYFEQVTYLSGDIPVEYSDVWVRSDRIKLSSLLTRDHHTHSVGPTPHEPEAAQ